MVSLASVVYFKLIVNQRINNSDEVNPKGLQQKISTAFEYAMMFCLSIIKPCVSRIHMRLILK